MSGHCSVLVQPVSPILWELKFPHWLCRSAVPRTRLVFCGLWHPSCSLSNCEWIPIPNWAKPMFSPGKFGLGLRDYDSNWAGFLSRRDMNSWVIHHPNYWVGQNVWVGFSIPSYRKTWINFFANPMLRGMEKGYLREIMKTGEAETRNHETALWFLKMSQVLSLPSFLSGCAGSLLLCIGFLWSWCASFLCGSFSCCRAQAK